MVTMRHVRQVRGCAMGTLAFLRRHGLDYRRFFREGLPVEQLEAIDDAMARRVAEAARTEAASGRIE